ncbi:MAG: TlpA family protein disulfide reductase [Prevotella sp.]|nr:TlpA family protein disulfide reductase [Prevotella sp.]
MKHWIIIAVALLALAECAAAQENDGFYSIKNEMDSMAESENLLVERRKNTALTTIYFKYILNEKEMAQDGFVPEILKRLMKAFDNTQEYSSESMQRHAWNIDALPMEPMTFVCDDSFFGKLAWTYTLTQNYRYTCLQMGDSLCNKYLMLWKDVQFTDYNGKPFACIDGQIMEIAGLGWRRTEPLQRYDINSEHSYARYDADVDNDTTEFVKLRENLRIFSQHYAAQKRRNNAQEMSGVAYITKQMCEKFSRNITLAQYNQVAEYLNSMTSQETNDARKRLFIHARMLLQEKIDMDAHERPTSHAAVTAYAGRLITEEKSKNIFNQYAVLDRHAKQQNINWILTGDIAAGRPFIIIDALPSFGRPHKYRYDDGKIDFRKDLPYGSVVMISDGSNGNCWALVVDSVPVSINMENGEITASALNKRFMDYQKRILLLQRDMTKYVVDIDSHRIIDKEGFDAARNRLDRLYYDIIRKENGNSIAKYYLADKYPGLSFAQLDSVMQNPAYREDLLTMPACLYYDGKVSRQPGRKYTDVTLEDSDGNKHRLSDYVGKSRYVLVHTWSVNSWWSRRNMFANKHIARDYDESDIKVIGVSPDNDDEWKGYIKARNMNWTMLADSNGWHSAFMKAYGITSMPETFIIGPDGTIVAEGLHGESLKAKVRELLGK